MKNKHEIAARLHNLKLLLPTIKNRYYKPFVKGEIAMLEWVLATEQEGTDIGVWIDQDT